MFAHALHVPICMQSSYVIPPDSCTESPLAKEIVTRSSPSFVSRAVGAEEHTTSSAANSTGTPAYRVRIFRFSECALS